MQYQIKKIRKIGGSLMVSIDVDIVKSMSLAEGDSIEMSIIKKIDLNKKIISYRCKKCPDQHFDTDEDPPHCNVCEATGEDLEVIENE